MAVWHLQSALRAEEALHMPEANDVSVIIPVFNEERSIEAALHIVQSLKPPVKEVLVVDGGSGDRTVEFAKLAGARVLHCAKGRARQMNCGAAAAQGRYLCFMHADSIPPTSLVEQVHRALADPHTVLGGFRVLITDPAGGLMRFQTAHHCAKTYYMPAIAKPICFYRGLRCLLGDQTMFCRACDFHAVGGFKEELVLMEDADLCIRMHMAGPCMADVESALAQRSTAANGSASSSSRHTGRCTTGRAAAPSDADDGRTAGMLPCGQESTPLLSEACCQQVLSGSCAGHGQASRPVLPARQARLGKADWSMSNKPTQGTAVHYVVQRRCRGRIVQVNNPPAYTSGRRMAALGNVRTTLIHFILGVGWLWGASPAMLRSACGWLYSDKHR